MWVAVLERMLSTGVGVGVGVGVGARYGSRAYRSSEAAEYCWLVEVGAGGSGAQSEAREPVEESHHPVDAYQLVLNPTYPNRFTAQPP